MHYQAKEDQISEYVQSDSDRLLIYASERYLRCQPVNDMEEGYPYQQAQEEARYQEPQPYRAKHG